MTAVSINVALISLGHSMPCVAATPNPKIRSKDLFSKCLILESQPTFHSATGGKSISFYLIFVVQTNFMFAQFVIRFIGQRVFNFLQNM